MTSRSSGPHRGQEPFPWCAEPHRPACADPSGAHSARHSPRGHSPRSSRPGAVGVPEPGRAAGAQLSESCRAPTARTHRGSTGPLTGGADRSVRSRFHTVTATRVVAGQYGRTAPVGHGSPPSPCRLVHSWVHSWGQTHTGVVTVLRVPSHPPHDGHLRRSARFGSGPSLHTRWTTLGAERHVDLWTKLASVHSDLRRSAPGPSVGAHSPTGSPARRPRRRRRPPSRWGRGPGPEGRGGQRQRIDMIRPATIAPNPIAKFHTPRDAMNGMRSPAT